VKRKWFILLFAAFAVVCGQSFAAKPQKNAAASLSAAQIFSIKIDYTNGIILVVGENLDPASTTATLGGELLTLDGASSSASILVFPFTPALSAFDLGNYIFNISTAGASFSPSIFIPLPLETAPPPPAPGPDCPCSTEWDQITTTASPDGVAGLTPYCVEDTASFVNVQFYDPAVYNYWVLWTEWTGSEGYCELYLDGPHRILTSQDQFDACAGYLRNIVTVWGNQNYTCLY
jgi:hypothetical protein